MLDLRNWTLFPWGKFQQEKVLKVNSCSCVLSVLW